MEDIAFVKNKKILVLGYAMTGRSVVEFLLSRGAEVTLNDRSDLENDSTVQPFIEKGVKVVGLEHPISLLDANFDFIVKNPGIPYSIPFLQEALNRGIPIYTDIEMFSCFNPGYLVAITGSNGKTTTTSLVSEIFKQSDYQSYLAGNIGIPTLSIIPEVKSGDVVVMEVSSFQLMGTEKFQPHIACITNIFEAHIDYHGTRDAYVEAKLKLIANQTSEDYLVYNADLEELTNLVAPFKAQKVPFARVNLTDEIRQTGAYLEEGNLYFKGEFITSVEQLKIPGEHNIENALAAIAIAKLMSVKNEQIKKAISIFKGVPYRIQPIAVYNGIEYYNDSKSTNNKATITALKSFNKPTVYIGGGLDRGISFDELIPFTKNVKAAILYGEAKQVMAEMFEKGNVETIKIVETLEEATNLAFNLAESGDIVLLSPSCASWDQFKSYEDRGALFTKLVTEYINQ